MDGTIEIVLRLMALLVLVSALLPIAERLRLPHTVLLAGVGIAIGLLVVAYGGGPVEADGHGSAHAVLAGIGDLGLSPDSFLLVFLPPLLFTAGLTVEVRRLADEVAAVLLLAVVAVLVCTAVVGVTVGAVSDGGLLAAMLLGAIIATTDPAAVIAIFRDLGAPKRLTILVQGESLFNDAAAIAVFAILIDIAAGRRQPEIGEAVTAFVVHFAGGAAFGVLLGWLACALMSRLDESESGEATVTVALAYLAFVVGEHGLHVSGVVSVVAAALTVAAFAPVRLQPRNWHALLETWHKLEFWANSLIFVLAAILAAQVVSEADPHRFWLVPVVVAATLAARALVLYGLLPGLVLARLVEPIDHRFKSVILWGGLRGAVTMVLALSVARNPILPAELREFVASLAIGFVLFTLLVAAPTLRPLLRLLGLHRLGSVETALRNRVLALSQSRTHEQVAALARAHGMDAATLHQVWGTGDAAPVAEEMSDGELTTEERLRVGLLTCANHEREVYFREFDGQTIGRHLIGRLATLTDALIDRVKADGAGGFERATYETVAPSRRLRLGLALHRRLGFEVALRRAIEDRFELLLVASRAQHEVQTFNRAEIRPVLGATVSETIAPLLEARSEAIRRAFNALALQYPRYAEALAVQHLGRAALRLEAADYRQKLEQSLISREVFDDLAGGLQMRRQRFERRPPLDLGLELRDLVGRVPIFAELGPEARARIAHLLRPRLTMPGEEIISEGERGTAMYFIAAGAVDVMVANPPIRLGDGAFFGEIALLQNVPRTATVLAAGFCQLLVLERRDLHRLMHQYPEIAQAIAAVADQRLASNATLRAADRSEPALAGSIGNAPPAP